MSDYYTYQASMMFLLVLLIIGISMILCFYILLRKRKSKEYREIMSDMYVVGKIKQIAIEDKINLLEEFRQYTKFMKVKHIDMENLDSTIERELQEKVSEGLPKPKD